MRSPLCLRMALLALVVSCGDGDGLPSLPGLPEVPACKDLRASFQPCGGTLSGTWRLQGVCPEGSPFTLPASGYCPDRVGTTVLVQTGVVSLEEKNDALDFEVFLQDSLEVATFSLPETCLEEDTSCDEVTLLDGWEARCNSRGDTCECQGRQPLAPPPTTSWLVRIEGDEVLVLDSQGAVADRWPFCVEANRALLQARWPLSPDLADVPTLLVLGP